MLVIPEDGGAVDSGKEAVQPSPTNVDASRMPRTVSASVFIRAVTEAQALRVQIGKYLKLCDRNVTELRGLETDKGEEDSDQEEFDETQAELVKEFGKVKKANSEHIEVCFQIQKMANFMLSSDVEVSETDSKNKQDARKVLVACKQHEKETDTTVFDWKKENSKWLKKKKKVKKHELVEVGAGGEGTDVGKAKIIERLCESFKPTVLLSDDGNLKHKNQFRSDMEKYTRYNKAVLKDLPEGLYFDIFCSFCDQDMKTKLTNIKDIERMSPEKIWQQVEAMLFTSNPMYMRRIQAMEARIIKGETVSDYLTGSRIVSRRLTCRRPPLIVS